MKSKTHAIRIISGLMIPIVMSLGSCAVPASDDTDQAETYSTEARLDESFVMQEATDKLTLYSYTMNLDMITPAVNIFSEMYPDVSVDVVSLSDEEYVNLLSAELPAGKGPDLILSPTDDFGGDVYKTMNSNLFVDLNQLILRDDEFSLDGYIENVMNAGIYKGKRYIMPIEYGLLPLVTTEEILDEEGFSADSLQTYEGFLDAARQYNERHADDGDKSALSAGDTSSMLLRNFLIYGSFRLIDYEKNAVSIDETSFKEVMEFIKDAPKNDPPDFTDSMGAGLISRRNLFDNSLFSMKTAFISEIARIQNSGQTPLTFMWKNADNGVTAEVINAAAIPKVSENQVNAYRFLKILLSEEIQGGNSDGITYLRYGHPVIESSLRAQMKKDFGDSDIIGSEDEKYIDSYIDLVVGVSHASLGTPDTVEGFVEEAMSPFWDGKKSYDECCASLVSMLELYKDE